MIFNLSLLIFSLTLSLTISTSIKKGYSHKKCCPFSKKKRAVINYSVDNVANYYSINGVKTDLTTQTGYDNWPTTKTINTMLAPGDIFCLNGNNVPLLYGNENTNPAAMIASIKYFDYNNQIAWLNTGSKWSCDGVRAKLFNRNNDSSSIWYTAKNGMMANIRPNAWWIWNTEPWSQTSRTTCCVTIPCCIKNTYRQYDNYDEEEEEHDD
jgi:hypothetical protein